MNREPLTASRFVRPAAPSPWPADILARINQPVSEAGRFLGAAHTGRNVFLTGMAGTGKSTLLRQFIDEHPEKVSITAPTGVAALNVGGMTLHRFCGMRLGPAPGQSDEDFYAELTREKNFSVLNGFRRIKACNVLVIDEVSMLPGRILDFVDFLFRRVRAVDAPFGGCQLITTGDFLQLPPVRSNPLQSSSTTLNSQLSTLNSGYDWAFRSRAWQEAEFKTILLEEVKRQDEQPFVRALSQFRRGHVWGDNARLLQQRVRHHPPADLPRLYTHNVQVDKWNAFQLDELPGDPVALEAITAGPDHQVQFLRKNLLTPSTLLLKPGALVMFTVNKTGPHGGTPLFVNGQIGTVESIASDISVRTRTGDLIPVERFTWQYDRKDPASATFLQFPLRLAYAMTIHKAQGLTMDAAYLDIRAAREPGQAYVAVSRVRTLSGLNFKEWFRGIFVSQDAINFYENN